MSDVSAAEQSDPPRTREQILADALASQRNRALDSAAMLEADNEFLRTQIAAAQRVIHALQSEIASLKGQP